MENVCGIIRPYVVVDALKKALVSGPLLKPLDYIRDYFLYIVTYKDRIGMVLV
jgi:hypothetical protein